MRSNARLFLIYTIAAILLVALFLIFANNYVRIGSAGLVALALALALVGVLAGAAVQYFVLRPAQKEVEDAQSLGREELEQRVGERTAALHRNAARLGILHEIDQSLLAARRPEIIALAAIGRISRLVPCQHAMVIAVEPDGEIRVLASQSASDAVEADDLPHSRADLYGQLMSEPILTRGHIYGIEDLRTLAQRSPVQQALYEMGARQYVVVPLLVQDELAGTLNLESVTARSFTANHVTIAKEVGTSLAVAIRQARLNAQVQQELEERMQAEAVLQRRTMTLEARNAELDAFAHTVAHDLQNPLTSMLGFADLLRQRRHTMSEERQEDYLQILSRSARKMSTIVDELLLLASVRSRDDIELECLDMGHIVREARARLRYLTDELGAEIEAPEEWPVSLGYGPWVEEVWANYLSNALKYGGRPPRIELGFTLPDGQIQTRELAIRYWVRDNGPGLTPEQQAGLFTPFERLHEGRAPGHGLGLSIVQRIVHKLGGRIGVESTGQPDQGSTFYFTLPPAAEGQPKG
jgi:signal transduction histidine kinase